jgi:hypothetical protein
MATAMVAIPTYALIIIMVLSKSGITPPLFLSTELIGLSSSQNIHYSTQEQKCRE